MNASGSTFSDDMQVVVNSAPSVPNVPPVANAGPDQTITLPTSTVSLVGTATDTDGTIASYAWTQVSCPGTCTIMTPNVATTTVTNLTTAGTYVFRFTATDNAGKVA